MHTVSPNLPKGLEPPANQVSNKGAPFWKGRAPQEGAGNEQLPTISTLQLNFPLPPHTAWDLLLLPPTADSSSLLTPRLWGGPHTPPSLLGMVASVCGLWPQCGQLETTQAITLKSGSSMTLLQFLNLPGCGGNCIRKFSSHTPLHTPGAWWPRCAASGLSVDIWRPPRPSHWSQDQAWLYFSSWIFLALEEIASESSAVSAWGWGHGVLACLLGCL